MNGSVGAFCSRAVLWTTNQPGFHPGSWQQTPGFHPGSKAAQILGTDGGKKQVLPEGYNADPPGTYEEGAEGGNLHQALTCIMWRAVAGCEPEGGALLPDSDQPCTEVTGRWSREGHPLLQCLQ